MAKTLNILITGDTHLGGGRVRKYTKDDNIKSLFREFILQIKEADLAITNLESPLIEGGSPISKTGPNLKSPVKSIQILKKAGFNLVTLANNHIMDYGEEGLFSTIEVCTNADIKVVGAGKNLEKAKQPYISEINGIRISVINIAENEFGTTSNDTPGCHPLDPIENYYTISEAKNRSDFVLVIIHGGHEYYELPSPRMKKTYRFFAESGADAVVGHHTHCISGYEEYNGVPIFYSLGNFLFDKEKSNHTSISSWNIGFMLQLVLNNKKLRYEVIPYVQNAEEVGIRNLNSEEKLMFDKELERLNSIIADDEELENHFSRYCEKSSKLYNSYIEPHSIRLIHALRNRNLIPSMLSKHKKRLLLNLARCEAHRDVLIKTLS